MGHRPHRAALLLVVTLAACADRDEACRLTLVAGPMAVMEGFARGAGISEAPAVVPARLVARYLGGPAALATVRPDSASGGWRITAEPPDADTPTPGYAVLVTDRTLAPLGVLLYDGAVLPGYPEIGRVAVGGFVLPLLGVRVDPATVTDAQCPLFPTELLDQVAGRSSSRSTRSAVMTWGKNTRSLSRLSEARIAGNRSAAVA